MGVSQLWYLVLNVSNLEAWRDLASSVIGAEERRDEPSDQVRLRFDEHDRMTSFYMKTPSGSPWNTAGAGCWWTMPCGRSSITRRPSSGATSSWASSRGEGRGATQGIS